MAEVKDIRNVTEMLSAGNRVPSSGRSNSKTTLGEWENRLNKLTSRCEFIFSKDVFSRIITFNAPRKVVEVYKACAGSDSAKISSAVQSLLFSLQPKATKVNFAEGNGKLHSEFKYSVVQNSFYNVCRNSFGIFSSGQSKLDQEGVSRSSRRGLKNGIERPSWLVEGFVHTEHINNARLLIEGVNQSRKSKVRSTPSADDIASHASLRVYRLLGAHLHKGREYMRTTFFQALGYIFVPWSDYVNDNDQRKMLLSFPYDGGNYLVDIDEIPLTATCSLSAGAEKVTQVNTTNKTLLKSLFSRFKGLVLHVQHDVHVTCGGGSQRKHSGGDRRNLSRFINLIDVACDVLVEYSRVGTIEIFLRSHEGALRCVMIFAFLIKKLSNNFMGMYNADVGDFPKPQDVVVHDTSLKEFLPGATIQETYLNSRCLRFDERVYEMLNIADDDKDVRGDSSVDGFDLRIEESDELGVAAI